MEIVYWIEKLNLAHSNLEFNCGDPEINEYFNNRSYEDVELNKAQVYVFSTNNTIIGFYSLSMDSIYTDINSNNDKKRWPICLIGQLGINEPFQNQGWGTLILTIAIEKALALKGEIGCVGLKIQTYKKEYVEGFYGRNNFVLVETNLIEGKERFTLFLKFPP